MPAIELDHVSKVYRRHGRRRQFATLKSALLTGSLVRHLRPDESFSALRDVSVSVSKGACFGVIGRNGSGKSTLLKLVAGITKPTSGSVRVHGRVSALIELGAGFHPEISGRENVFINGIMLGLSRREISDRFDEIVEFAELEDFIDAPVKTYSSGMYMRLGFAVAINVDPDILLVDEVLAVGDAGFSLKCLDKFAEFKRRGKTILLVTHGLSMVERFCDEAVWLEAGESRTIGDPKRVVQRYLTDVEQTEDKHLAAQDAKAQQTPVMQAPADPQALSDASETQGADDAKPPADMFSAKEGRWGSGAVRIQEVTLEGPGGPAHVFHTGDPMTIRMQVSAAHPVDDFAFGVSIFSPDGVCCYGTNTDIEEMRSKSLQDDGHRDHRGRRVPEDLQARRRGPQARRVLVRLPSVALHVPGEVQDQGRGHLPAQACLALHRQRAVQGARQPDRRLTVVVTRLHGWGPAVRARPSGPGRTVVGAALRLLLTPDC